MSVNYGSKRVVVGAHYGLRDWLADRRARKQLARERKAPAVSA